MGRRRKNVDFEKVKEEFQKLSEMVKNYEQAEKIMQEVSEELKELGFSLKYELIYMNNNAEQ